MSSIVKYDYSLFKLERAEFISARLGEFKIGVSKLGRTSSSWVTIDLASFSLTEGYTVDEHGTLIYDSETATVKLQFWDDPDADRLLYPSDRVRASYDGTVFFLGTVDSTATTVEFDPDAMDRGHTHRTDFTATLVGTYAALLGAKVCWKTLPVEQPVTRIRRWLRVDNYA